MLNADLEKKARIAKLAAKAARKHATPPEVVNERDDINEDSILIFAQKVLMNALTPDECAQKILEKSSEGESKIQIGIIEKVKKLNLMLINKKPTELFNDRACSILHNEILDLQISQNYASVGWKVIAFPTMIPMTRQITLYTSAVFHTRRCNLFFSWTLGQKFHPDHKMAPMQNFCDESNVEQQNEIGLVEKPTPSNENENDWPIESSLENLDESSNSSSSSIDSGKTIVPVMSANDISNIGDSVDTTTQDSYLDISFIQCKRRLNLTKQEKVDILQGCTKSPQSTPVRQRDSLHPRLGTSFKKASMTRFEKNLASSDGEQPGYIQAFLNKWFKNQIANMTNELQREMNKMD